MILKRISIVNYKNIQAANLDLSPKINCLIGHNGAGKTNFLDAAYYLSFCKSAFGSRDSQLITHGRDFFVIDGSYTADDGQEENIYCGMKRGQKKHFKRNKKEYRRLSQHIGLIPLVFVSPSDSILIEGFSEERRKLMDVVISQYDHTYIEALTNYNKALQQRNSLLKQEEEPDAALLDLWEEQMAESGRVIYEARTRFVDELIPVFRSIYNRIARESEEVSLRYVSHGQRGDLLDVIRRDRAKDRAVGYSLHGVHRDDLEMLIDGYPMKLEGSPLLLLDVIFDKLDSRRVEQIVGLVAGEDYGQIFITDTNRENLDRILDHCGPEYKIFTVDDGDIEERKEEHDV